LAQTAALEKRITASADAAAMQKPMHRLTHVLTLHLRFAAALTHKKMRNKCRLLAAKQSKACRRMQSQLHITNSSFSLSSALSATYTDDLQI
jgi:hypothetical protein